MAMMTLTYGQLPNFDAFELLFDAATADSGGTFSYNFMPNETDSDTAARYGIPPEGEVSARKLFGYLQGLVNGWEEDSDEEAGSMASSILSVLGIEWV